MADLRSIQIDADAQVELLRLVTEKKALGQRATIREEAAKAIARYVKSERRRMEATDGQDG
jgi:hypothetical protein